jgi:hypothetical protein
MANKSKKVLEHIVDVIVIKIATNFIWLWIAIELLRKDISGIDIYWGEKYFAVERFIPYLI